jgi:hypothetical protein
MPSQDTYLAFAIVMVLFVPLVAIAIDWFGKPIKRRFVPKMYRYPDERRRREAAARPTRWSEATFVLPLTPELTHEYAERERAAEARESIAALVNETFQQPVPQVMLAPPVFDQDVAKVTDPDTVVETAPVPVRPVIERRIGWQVGDYIYNLTVDGREPSPATVRGRYWRNVAAAESAQRIFGTANLARMTDGKPPRRRNPRNGRIETMVLPTAGFVESAGRAPVPYWPGNEIDPFAEEPGRR